MATARKGEASRPVGVRAAVYAGIALLTAVVYFQTRNFAFISIDDPGYVVQNPRVLAGLSWDGLAWAFTTFHKANWHPLTWISLMLDATIGGGEPPTFHLVNVALHAANALLLLVFLERATGALPQSAFVAAVFAVHPLHVESVAWVTERKDVLSAFFGFLTLLAYAGYARRPSAVRYGAVVVLYALGLLAKPMLVTWPVLLLLVDVWPLRRMPRGDRDAWRGALRGWGPLLDKVPLAILAVVSGGITIVAQWKGGGVTDLETIPMGMRVANALVSYVDYVAKTVWPIGLAFPYPYRSEALTPIRVVACAVLLATATTLACRRAARAPYLLTGWVGYLVLLLPVIGLVQVGLQPMADRYMYLPMVGLAVVVAWGVPDLVRRLPTPSPATKARILVAVATAVTLALAACARVQAGYWRDSITLLERTLALTGRNLVAELGLGMALLDQGRPTDAVAHLREAARIRPQHFPARLNLGAALYQTGDFDAAVAEDREAVRLRPDDLGARENLAMALLARGDATGAAVELEEVLRRDPDQIEARRTLAATMRRLDREDDAVAQLRDLLRRRPGDAEARTDLAKLLAARGRFEAAMEVLAEAVRLDPTSAVAHNNLGVLLMRAGRTAEAIDHFEQATRLDPVNEGARRNLQRARAVARSPRP